MLFFHVGLATQIVMVVLFLLPPAGGRPMANRVELRRDLYRTHHAGNARPRCPKTAVAACGLRAGRGRHDDAALFHHRLAWLNGVADRYVVFDGGHIVQDYEADEFLSLSPGCVAAMGLRAFDLEPYRHRIAALASSPAAESGSTDNASLAIEWFAEDDTSLDTYEYAIDHVIEHGLESSPTFVLRTADPAAEDSPFRWLLAINPLPSRKAFAEGGLLSHLHFQYANDLHTLVATDEATGAETLRNPRWYAHHVRQRGNHRGPLRHHPCVAPLAVDLATYGGMTAPR